ncbi:MAG: hypothetical protein ACOC9P_00685 [bacterium]
MSTGTVQCSTFPVIVLAALLMALFAQSASAEVALRTFEPDRFYVTPEEDAVLQWQSVGDAPSEEQLAYEIRDFTGTPVTQGQAEVAAQGHVEIPVNLPRGYFTLTFPRIKCAIAQRESTQRFVPATFGICVLPPFTDEPDHFFGIHAELEKNLVPSDASEAERLTMLDGLVKALNRSGIRFVRNRLRPALIRPAADVWDWDGKHPAHHYEPLLAAFERHDMRMVPFFALAPQWTRREEDIRRFSPWVEQYKYPTDMQGMTDTLLGIHDHWSDVISAIQVYNEPGLTTEDRLGPLMHAMAYAFDAADLSDRPLIGGPGFGSGFKGRYARALARADVLEILDYISFHTYAAPTSLEATTTAYRKLLAEHGREDLPIWLTESGRNFRGGLYPDAATNRHSSSYIIGNAIEARALGLVTFHPYIYGTNYPHRTANKQRQQYAMIGPNGTPFGWMAAYVNAVQLLAHSEYLGDLRIDDTHIKRARVFGAGDDAIVAIYTDPSSTDAEVTLDLPIREVIGVDGRELPRDTPSTVPVPDGLSYAVVARNEIADHLDTETEAMRLYRIGRSGAKQPRGRSRPIVLQHLPDYRRMEATDNGYMLAGFEDGPLELTFRIANLSQQDAQITLMLETPAWLPSDARTRVVTVPAREAKQITWPVSLDTDQPGVFGHVTLRGESDAGEPTAPVSFDIICPRDLDSMLATFEQVHELDVTHRDSWRLETDGTSTIAEIASASDGDGVELSMSFGGNQGWVNAAFDLPPELARDASGIVVVAGGQKKPDDAPQGLRWPRLAHISINEEGGARFRGGGIPSDGEMHVTYLRYDRMPMSPWGQHSDTQILDPNRIDNLLFMIRNGQPDHPFQVQVHGVYLVGSPK